MQKIYKVFLSLIIFLLVSLLIPFNISADSVYFAFNDNDIYYLNNTNDYYFQRDTGNVEIRTVGIGYASDNFSAYFVVKDTSGVKVKIYARNGFSSRELNSYYDAPDGYRYWYLKYNYNATWISNYYATYGFQPHISGNTNAQDAYYYTYGDGSAAVPEYGALKIGFETSIAYSGGNSDAWRLNKDTIYFDRYDTLGNDLFGLNIELQAIPYSVEGASQQNIFAQGINDYIFDTVKVGSLGYWSPGQGNIDFTWEYVTNRFSPTWWSTYGDNWSLFGWKLSEKWYRVGWAYRARLVDDDYNVLIDWQWIYNGTSIDGQDVNNIINNNGLTPELVNSINNINNNNNTTNNNYYNNQVINYTSSDPTTDGSWIEQLISSILQTLGDLIGKILDFFSSIFDGLVDLILGLFGDINPADSFFNWFSNLFNGIGEIDLTLPQFNIPNTDLSSFNRLVQETLNIFSFNNFGFVIFIPLLLLIIKAVF